MRQRATVFQRGNSFYLHSDSKAVTGAWVSTHPFLSVEAVETDAVLGAAIRAALGGSKEGVPHPTDIEKVFQPMYELAHVKSWNAFANRARCCQVTDDGGTVRIQLREKRGSGFVPHEGSIIELADPSDQDLGAAVKRVLQSSGSPP